MAQIVINEISQNFTYNIGTSEFAQVALPITASWGPAFVDPESVPVIDGEGVTDKLSIILEELKWSKFSATQSGLDEFVSTYRGPAANYRTAHDYSYQTAMTLLTAGYDILVCRLCPGTESAIELVRGTWGETFSPAEGATAGSIYIKAKYPGSFGDNIKISLKFVPAKELYNLIIYVVDSGNIQEAVENHIVTLNPDKVTDNIPYIGDITSNYIKLAVQGNLIESASVYPEFGVPGEIANEYSKLPQRLSGGDDKALEPTGDDATAIGSLCTESYNLALKRYKDLAGYTNDELLDINYIQTLKEWAEGTPTLDRVDASNLRYKQWLYTHAWYVYDILKDKLAYNAKRIISPGWDDQDIGDLSRAYPAIHQMTSLAHISPLHIKLMDVAYNSRCGTALLDIPRSLYPAAMYNDSGELNSEGYAQKLARYKSPADAVLYHTHSALFAPWGQYKYVGMSKQVKASPSFMALMIQRSMLLNQSLQYEWMLPSNRNNSVQLGKLDFIISQRALIDWQTQEGAGINIITQIPDLGTVLWGNSTIFEVPPATYQALSYLSTRYLFNAIKNVTYKVGTSITYQYNNDQAYNKFYAGMTPILDTMKNVGAIDNYYIRMSQDINGLDQINANTVIGKIYLVINGVINDIIVDMVALPPGTDLNQFRVQ